jgi:hypothetical protein
MSQLLLSSQGQWEQEIKPLLDPEYNRRFRKQAEDEAGKLDTETWRNLRKLAKTDPFFLAYGVLGYTKLSTNLHGHLVSWMKRTEPLYNFRLLLLPRGHYKSTIWTITDSIRAALPDEDEETPWPYCLGPDIRVCIMHEVEKVASKFLSSIQNHFLSNIALMKLFPECIPDTRKHTVNMLQFQLPRKSHWIEKTFEVMGVGGRSQGNHYNLLKPDDLIGKEAADSKAIMQSTIDWVDNIQSYLTSFSSGDKIDFTGTRWAHVDLYSHLMEVYGDDLAIYKRAVEEKNPETGEWESIFPEEYPRERLRILRKKPKIFSAQYLNDPDLAESDLGTDKLRYFYWSSRKSIKTFDMITKTTIEYDLSEMHKTLLLDPATTNQVGIIVTGIPKTFKIFILEAIKGSFPTPKLINTCCNLILRYGIHQMVVEDVNFSALYSDIFTKEFLKRGIKCKIVLQRVPRGMKGIKKNEGKLEKIKATFPMYLDSYQLYINETQKDLYEEFRKFGSGVDVHLLDSLWLGTKHWRCFDPKKDIPSGIQLSTAGAKKLDEISGYSTV